MEATSSTGTFKKLKLLFLSTSFMLKELVWDWEATWTDAAWNGVCKIFPPQLL